jgi:hypothetical protein
MEMQGSKATQLRVTMQQQESNTMPACSIVVTRMQGEIHRIMHH